MCCKQNDRWEKDNNLLHDDDLKISYVNPNAVDKVVNWLKKLYPQVTATQGKMHDYLGMTFNFSMPGKVKVPIDD